MGTAAQMLVGGHGREPAGAAGHDARRQKVEVVAPSGDGGAADMRSAAELFPQVYDEMRRIAGRMMSRDVAVGAQVMRRLLINHARDRAAVKRGRSWERVALTEALARPGRELFDIEQLVTLNRAVEKLAGLDDRQAAVVTLRFFGGLEIEQIAEVLGVSKRTVDYDWLHARAWLLRELAGGEAS